MISWSRSRATHSRSISSWVSTTVNAPPTMSRLKGLTLEWRVSRRSEGEWLHRVWPRSFNALCIQFGVAATYRKWLIWQWALSISQRLSKIPTIYLQRRVKVVCLGPHKWPWDALPNPLQPLTTCDHWKTIKIVDIKQVRINCMMTYVEIGGGSRILWALNNKIGL
jgi:hypothetical protein